MLWNLREKFAGRGFSPRCRLGLESRPLLASNPAIAMNLESVRDAMAAWIFTESFKESRPRIPGASPCKRAKGARLRLEELEPRTLLSYTFTPIVVDSFGLTLSSTSMAINNSGTVSDSVTDALISGNGGPLTTIASSANGFSTLFAGSGISASGLVPFFADLGGGPEAVFVGSGGPLTTIADNLGSFRDIGSDGTISQAGRVAFVATQASGVTGVFTGDGGSPTLIADATGPFQTSVPDGAFGPNPALAINDAGMTAFFAHQSNGLDGIFTSAGGGVFTTIADSSGVFSNFGPAAPISLNDVGTVAFWAQLANGRVGLFTGNGGLVATVADSSGPFQSFSFESAAINDRGEVAFSADLRSGGKGVFTGPDPVADKVLTTGDPLFGSTVKFVNTTNRGLNDAGQIALFVALTNGTNVVVRADPGPAAPPQAPPPPAPLLPGNAHASAEAHYQDLSSVPPIVTVDDPVKADADSRVIPPVLFGSVEGHASAVIPGSVQSLSDVRGAAINLPGTMSPSLKAQSAASQVVNYVVQGLPAGTPVPVDVSALVQGFLYTEDNAGLGSLDLVAQLEARMTFTSLQQVVTIDGTGVLDNTILTTTGPWRFTRGTPAAGFATRYEVSATATRTGVLTVPAGQVFAVESFLHTQAFAVAPRDLVATADFFHNGGLSYTLSSSTPGATVVPLGPPPPTADMAITNSGPAGPVQLRDNVTYTLTVANHGPNDAHGVTVIDGLPGGFTLVSATPSQGSATGTGNIVCNLGTLAKGASATVTIVARTTAAGSFTDTASVAALEGDPDTTNNLATAATLVVTNSITIGSATTGDSVTLTSPAGTYLANVQALSDPDLTGALPAGTDATQFPEGFFGFEVHGLAAGAHTTVTVDLPAGQTVNRYFKFGPTRDAQGIVLAAHWYDFSYDPITDTGAETHATNPAIPANEVILHFADGLRGDDDLTANGVIVDAGGPAFLAKADQTIAFGALANKTYGAAPFTVSATASSGLPVSFVIVSGPVTIAANNVITIAGAGPVVVRASQAGNASFNAAPSVDQSFTVAPAPLTITADNQTKVFGAAVPALTASYSGFVNGDTAASLTTPPTLTTAATATSNTRSYPITVSGAVDPNYLISYVNGALTVTPASTTTAVVSSVNPSVFAQPVSFTATVAASAPGAGTPTGSVTFLDGATSLAIVPLVGGVATYTSRALERGSHSLTAAYSGDSNFLKSTSPELVQTVQTVALEPDPLDPAKQDLVVGGTRGDNRIEIDNDGEGSHKRIEVEIRETKGGGFRFESSYAAESVVRLIVFGGPGNDNIRVDEEVTLPALLFAGDGNDRLEGGGGLTVLVGGAGHDHLDGGTGRNILIAGSGRSKLRGRGEGSILIGGTTDYDANIAALCALMAEWSRTDEAYLTRVHHLDGSLAGGVNGPFFLNAHTVHASANPDLLEGSRDDDALNWFFASALDVVKHKKDSEVITAIS